MFPFASSPVPYFTLAVRIARLGYHHAVSYYHVFLLEGLCIIKYSASFVAPPPQHMVASLVNCKKLYNYKLIVAA